MTVVTSKAKPPYATVANTIALITARRENPSRVSGSLQGLVFICPHLTRYLILMVMYASGSNRMTVN